ncbi:MAG: S46 family peptidase [Oligoflexales bacterium]|nr:S46 family peptidase [Oligoflexales bacterium]
MNKTQNLYRFGFVGLLALNLHSHSHAAENWTNPGGMWMPSQINEQKELLENLGLVVPADDLSDPASSTLQGIVSFGYCSGSFISNDGLIITNHHCVSGMLSYLTNKERADSSDPEADYVKNGFHAKTLGLEKNVGPTERIFITVSQENITDRVLEGVLEESDLKKRGQLIEDHIKSIVNEEEAKADNIRAEVKSFYRDESFILIKKLEIKDVRMVFAPSEGVGFYGGDSDNWVWPRHTGDFGIIRAYVAPDGSSREYHPDNVPYHPENIIEVAQNKDDWVENKDLIFVAGYPGSTNRLDTAQEVRDEVAEDIPYLLDKYQSFRDLLGELSKVDDLVRTKLQSPIFSLDNFLKNRTEALEALEAISYLEEKTARQYEFEQWIRSDEELENIYGDALEKMEELRLNFKSGWKTRAIESDLTAGFSARLTHLIQSAIEIIRMSQERPKEDADRDPAYQRRNWQRWMQGEESSQKTYDQGVAKAILKWVLERSIQLDDCQIPEAVKELVEVKQARENPEYLDQKISELFAETQMESLAYRQQLFNEASFEQLQNLNDPIIKCALILLPSYVNAQDRAKRIRGAYLEHAPMYIKALKEFYASKGRLLAPDANSTLRVTFGHVLGYERPSNQQWQAPFTNINDLKEKNQWGDEEFEVPADVLREVYAGNFEPYTDVNFGHVPVNFLASVDTTGGNSGSAALNSKGQLIGLLFDGNQDALYSDWIFKEEGVRSILVDVRYVLWILDKVADAQNVIEEIKTGTAVR